MNIVKSVFIKKEMAATNPVRVFAIKVNTPEELVLIASRTVTPINKNGFLNYFTLPDMSPIITNLGDRDRILEKEEKDILKMAKKEFEECGGEGECVIFFHEDLKLCYPERKELVEKRYPGIKVVDDIREIIK